MKFRPITGNEHFYLFPNCKEINQLVGFQCRIRGNFGDDGNHLQTTVFPDSNEFFAAGVDATWGLLRQVFMVLRSHEVCNGFLADREQMNAYCKATATTENTGLCSYGFRFDYDLYTFMICCYPNEMAYDFEVYMYLTRKLDDHLRKCEEDIRIVDANGRIMLRVEEGTHVRLITHGGETRDMTIRYAGHFFFVTDAEWGTDCYHIDDFAQKFAKHGCKDIFPLPKSSEGMTKEEFISLIGKDLVVDYPFGRELQRWSMKNFEVDKDGNVRHKRITSMLTDGFIAHCRNPHWGKATHG
jgi:hypothetical protein